MPAHDLGLLSTLVLSLVAAFAGGLAARTIGLPPLLGYLLAGVAIGPFTPGFTANQEMASELAEIGVALLLFNIGLHFSFKELLRVRKIVIPGALIQVTLTTAVGALIATWVLDLALGGAIVIGLCMAIASTAVVTRNLDERRQLTSVSGRVALGWLVVQDLVVIIALVLVPVFGEAKDVTTSELTMIMGKTFLQVAGFVVVMGYGGRRIIPWLLGYVARVGSREMFTLAVIVIALGIAYGSSVIFGVSLALGAFFAGVVIGESDLNLHAASEALSMQQVFTILFFVSVGMLFDPMSIVNMPVQILAFLATIILGTGLLTFILLLFLRVPVASAALVGGAFAQIGEFSFVLGELGYRGGFYASSDRDLIVAVALLSIMINPVMMWLAIRFGRWLRHLPYFHEWRNQEKEFDLPDIEGLHDHTILVGHGRVGRVVAGALQEHGLRYVSIESDRKLTERIRKEGGQVIFGDASREAVLEAASPETAKLMIVAVADTYFAKQIIRVARKSYPNLPVVVRTHSDEEARTMTRLGVSLAVMGEREVAFGIILHVLQTLGLDPNETRTTISQLRDEIYLLDREDIEI